MKEDSLTTKGMLLDIGAMRRKALGLVENGKPYNVLLQHILAKDFYYDEEQTLPSLKELAEASGLKSGKVRKYIEGIYHDLALNYETKQMFSFVKVRYEFIMRGRRKRWLTLEADHLPIAPRIGEEIMMPFFSEYLGTARFYVDEVNHEFEEDVQVVKLWLREGDFNAYWHYRKHKAKEEYEISIHDWFDLEEYQLKRKLGVGERFWSRIGKG
ncbi:hypothetical protein [Pontibacter kalidii]|uniref:hypothetical protein n=1 Tax=Pontibacter kalidii TaxID=2592049 RepID=UPI0022531BE5|nr:hypothetical protein [Pontibacter kalidii]